MTSLHHSAAAVSRDTIRPVPRKVRELLNDLVRAGFLERDGKGSHRNFSHPSGVRITLSGRPGDDAKRYQEQEVA